jgi:predicted PurR-regulated permease PerM
MSQTGEGHRVTTVGFYGAALLIVVLAYRIVEPFLAEIGWAVVLAICLAPVQARLSRHLGPTRSAVYLTLLVLFALIVPLLVVARMLAEEGAQLVSYVRIHMSDPTGPLGLFHTAWQWLRERFSFLPSEERELQRLSQRMSALGTEAANNAGRFIMQAVGFVVSLTITLCILFFMLKDGPAMARGVRRLLPFGPDRNAALLVLIHDIVATSVTSTLVIAALQGILGGLAFLCLGVPGPFFWGCMMAVLAVLPVVGATLVWAPAAAWLALSGSFVKGVILALVGVLVLGTTDNVVRPLMLMGKTRMSTLVLIISLLGGVSAFGFIGIVLGPVVGAVLTAFIKTYALVPEAAPEAPAPAPLG